VEYNEPLPPPLKDSIIYGSLGQGKIVFERIAPANSNNSSGGYVLDINNQKSWSFYNSLLDGPSISPDGKIIAFTKLSSAETYYDVYTTNVDGSNLTKITAKQEQEYSPAWSPNSDYIYSIAFNLSFDMYQTSLSSHTSNLVFSTQGIDGPASVASDGRILFSSSNNIKVWQNNSFIILKSTSNAYNGLYSPSFNPQGNKIAYIEATTDSIGHFYKKIKVIKMDSSGNNSVTLIEMTMLASGNWSGSNNISLSWSPDGTKIAFNKPEYENCAHIYVVNSDGTNLAQVTSADGVYDRSVSWGK